MLPTQKQMQQDVQHDTTSDIILRITLLWYPDIYANTIYISNFNIQCKVFNNECLVQIFCIIIGPEISDLIFWSTEDDVVYLNAHKDFGAYI